MKYWYTWKLFKVLCYTFKSFVEEEFNEYYLLMSRYSWNTAKGGVKHQFRQSKTICCTIKIRYKATTGWFNSATVGHFCFCLKPGPGFPSIYVVIFYIFNDLRWEVIVHFVDIVRIVDHFVDIVRIVDHFVDIVRIVDHNCLNCFFIYYSCFSLL